MGVKTVKDLKDEGKSKKKKKPESKKTVKKDDKPKEVKKGKEFLFVPFAPEGVDTSAIIEIRYEKDGVIHSKKATVKIKDRKYELNRSDFPKGFEDKFIAQLYAEGFMNMPQKDPNLPTEWKIRHGDFADGQRNNFTGKGFVDLPDGGKIELNWKDGFVETKDEKIRDILVSKGHYDMTTNSLFVQKPDPEKQVVTGVGKGAYTMSETPKQKESKLFEPSKGTFTK